jgi:hypothetical protein
MMDLSGDSLAQVINIFNANMIGVDFIDLSRPDLGLAVVRAVAPKLQTDPAGMPTQRLADAIRTHGGGAGQTRGAELF